jgi:mannose-1-phosphate guanylyltransferase/mannose-6-phosphate isomerase
MLDVFGAESLLVSAVRRGARVCSGGALLKNKDRGVIWIVVGEFLHDEIRNHLMAHDDLRGLDIRYIIEPCARNTAPALALAAATVAQDDPAAQIIMLPSDHICNDDGEWVEVVAIGCRRALRGDLVTIGLRPTHPAIGYGYIKFDSEEQRASSNDCADNALGDVDISDKANDSSNVDDADKVFDSCSLESASDPNEAVDAKVDRNAEPSVYRVEEFVEKPDKATAKRYVESGEYLWNSGMLIANAHAVINELRACGAKASNDDGLNSHPNAMHSERIASIAEALAKAGEDAWRDKTYRKMYEECPSVPFDTACLEVSENVSVVAADLNWSDVGSLESLADLQKADEAGNRLIGRAVDIESNDVLAYSESGRIIATLGLDNVMVVDSADATLVASRDRVQEVRKVVDALKSQDAPEVVQNKTSLRPWGSWTMLVRMPHYHVKEVTVLPGMRLSSQSHRHRAEHWIIAEGTALVTCNGGTITLKKNESAFLPMGAVHRLENVGEDILRVVEVATGDYLGEDDIIRYEDDFGRKS